ncbi:MAG: helix-turn-helix transcriptional regulator [Armatimonadota bacterium]
MSKYQVWTDVKSARLCTAGRVYPDVTWMFPAHAHTYWEFIYFLRGTGRIDIPQGTIRPQQYHLVVYPPGLPHSEVTDPADPEETIFFGVEVSGSPPPGAHLLLPDPKGELRWLCEHILTEFHNPEAASLADSYMQAFLYLVERAWESGIPVKHDIVDLAVQYMNSSYSQNISLGDIADSLHISETYLVHCFTARLDISPMRYLQRVRIEAAKRLLATTDIPINEIAAQTGFEDPLYFSRVIKRVTGHSPTSFRSTTNCTNKSISDTNQSIHLIGKQEL